MEKLNNQELADKMVLNFINNFIETFGVKPKVFYNIDSNVPTLNEIFDCVNEQYQLIHPEKSICEPGKGDLAVKYRAIYYSVARHFGYTLIATGKLTNTNYSTVLHGLKQVSQNSPMKIKTLEILNNKLNQTS
jgi:hypothetical protein